MDVVDYSQLNDYGLPGFTAIMMTLYHINVMHSLGQSTWDECPASYLAIILLIGDIKVYIMYFEISANSMVCHQMSDQLLFVVKTTHPVNINTLNTRAQYQTPWICHF